MALKGKIYSIARQHDDLNTNELFQSMIDKSAAQDTIVMDGRNIAAGSIFAEQIHAKAITSEKIDSKAIKADHIDAGSIDVGTLWGDQLILPGENYGGVVINKDGLTMKSIGTAKLDIKLSSASGFNITDGAGNDLIDIDPKTGNVKMEVNQLTIGNYSAATIEDIDDIEVGGRNLIRQTELASGYRQVDGGSDEHHTNSAWRYTDYFIPVKGGDTFIVTGATNLGSQPATVFYDYRRTFISGIRDRRPHNNHIFKTPTNARFMRFSFEVKDLDTIKLEKGNKPTDWTPAPEDVQDSYTSVAESKANLAETSAKEYAKEQVDDIEVGGRNLVLGTTDEATEFSFYGYNGDNYLVSPSLVSEIAQGGTYILSANINELNASGTRFTIMVSFRTSSGDAIQQLYSESITSGYTGRFVQKINVPEINNFGYAEVHLRNISPGGSSNGSYSRLKFEKGNIPTGWTEAPEDTRNRIEERPKFSDFDKTDKVTINGGNIKAGTISSKNNFSKISLDDGTFSFGNGALSWNNNTLTIGGNNNLKTEIDKKATSEDVQNAIDDIEVGGRNLLRNSYDVDHTNNYLVIDDINDGEKLTIQLWGEGRVTLYEDDGYSGIGGMSPVGGKGYAKRTITAYPRANKRVLIVSNFKGNIKVERGNKPTDWTPAPEDVQDSYTSVAEAKAETAEGNAKDYAKKQVDDIEIGGRNLIIRSTETSDRWINAAGSLVSASNHDTSNYIEVEPNTDYMLTKNNSELATDEGYFRWSWYDVNMVYIGRTASSDNEVLWKTPNTVHYARVSYPTDSTPKLEKGNKPTAWSPSPEDERQVGQESLRIFDFTGETGNDITVNESVGTFSQFTFSTRLFARSVDKTHGFFWGGSIPEQHHFEINSSGRLRTRVNDNDAISPSNVIRQNQWHDIVVTANSSTGIVRQFVDGKLVHTSTATFRPLQLGLGSVFKIGSSSGSGREWDGFIDYLTIYDREMSTSQAIAISGRESSENAVLHYRLKGNADESIKGAHGTLGNNVKFTSINTPAAISNNFATDAKNKTDAWSWNGTTEIDGTSIRTGTITANQIAAGSITADKIVMGTGSPASGNLAAGRTFSGRYSGTVPGDGKNTIGQTYVTFGTGAGDNGGGESAYIQVDLGTTRQIAESRIFWFAGDSRRYYYKIKYSTNGSTWFYAVGNSANNGWTISKLPSSTSLGGYEPTIDRFAVPITARYLRIYGNGNTLNSGNNIYEWELYSKIQTMISGSEIVTGTLTADQIKTGVLEDINKNTSFDLTKGTFNIGNKFKYNGSVLSVDADEINLKGKVTFTDLNQGLQTTVNNKVTQSDVDSSISNIEVGGRNLLLGTSDAPAGFDFPQNGIEFRVAKEDLEELLDGGKYTASVLIDELSSAPSGVSIMLSIRNANGGAFRQMDSSKTFYVGNTGILSHTFNVDKIADKTGKYATVHLRVGSARGAKGVYRKMKLEKGNMVTDWTPASEDVYNNLNSNGKIPIHGGNITTGTLSASKITTGTLDASKVTVKNLDANNITSNKTSFVESAWNGINSNLTINSSSLTYSHTDKSQTIINANGIFHKRGGTNYQTHFFHDVVTVNDLNHSSTGKWVTLPSIYKGKDFKAHAVVSDTYGVTNDKAYYNLAMLRVVCFIDQIDKPGGRVRVRGYSFHRDIRNNKTFRRAIQAKVIVSY